MQKEDINKIAEAIAAKIGQPDGPVVLGCGDASSSTNYYCPTSFSCSTYECGGAAQFACIGNTYRCTGAFKCYTGFNCTGRFSCTGTYNP